MKFKNSTYDILKEATTVWLPALGTFYFALSETWGLPYGEQIVGTITACVAFLGVCLHISTRAYRVDLQNNFNYDDYDSLYEVENEVEADEAEIDTAEE